jgi:hypothetical protein
MDSTTRTPDSAAAPWWQRVPVLPFSLTALFLAFLAFPRVHDHPPLVASFLGVAAVLAVWTAILWIGSKRWTQCFRIERAQILKQHYIQATVQTCVYAYWGWYWRPVYAEIPLFLAQIVFLYTFDALLSWSRGRSWRFGFRPLPIILSTNVFNWFKDDWYAFQFLLIATGALGKEFIKWNRDGRRTHIFNPSGFTLSLFSIVLIATGTTYLTWGIEIATTIGMPPHIYLEIFLLGLVVQYFFSVTLMTFSAAGVLFILNVLYSKATGTYHFVDTNLPIAIFLGLHLLMTDPSTSPRTKLGRVIFGGLYGLANFVLYAIFERTGIPEFYDKLLPIPILNLSVQVIDRFAKSGVLGRFTRWEAAFPPGRANLVYMGCWSLLFFGMLGTGYIEAPHEGASIEFWKKAYAEGKPFAGPKLLKLAGSQAQAGSGPASNELGVLYMEGKVAKSDHGAAAHYFARACEAGDAAGCANLATQFLFLHEARSDEDVARAFQHLERSCTAGTDARPCYLLGYAYETGSGRPSDLSRAVALYTEACRRGSLDACKGIVRLRLAGIGDPSQMQDAARMLEAACQRGDAESCLYLAYIYHGGSGVPRDDARALASLRTACTSGSEQACKSLQSSEPSPFAAPLTARAPRWSAGSTGSGG